MSLSSVNLRGALRVPTLSPADLERLRTSWRKANGADAHSHDIIMLEPGWKFEPQPLDSDLYATICKAQDRFKAPHLRWDWCHRMPFPFRWGPNGAFFLLLAMLGGYVLIVAVAALIVRAA